MANTEKRLKHYHLSPLNNSIKKNIPKANRKWFYGNELTKIYQIPKPTNNVNVVAVVSFGGGLYGNVANNFILTNGDVQAYWSSLGITDLPIVMVKTFGGAKNVPNENDDGATVENSIDVETIGCICPTSKLIIVLYIAENSFDTFPLLINYILNDTINYNNKSYSINNISISWGAPEIYYESSLLNSINSLFAQASAKGINITTATGDYGSNNGVGGSGSYCDFPASSPNVIAVGGTSLICPNLTYDDKTKEIAWSNGGGAVSRHFSKPSYQKKITTSKRSIPDISSNSDPDTGVAYLINGNYQIVGGTSIASPTISGYLAAINFKKFMNPILYNCDYSCFNDIYFGSNGNYSAKSGYDNCTGIGSIKGSTLYNILNLNLTISNPNINLLAKSNTKIITNLSLKYLTFSSNDSSIAKVDNSGLIVGIKPGKTIVKINTINPYISGTIIVSVEANRNLKGRFLTNNPLFFKIKK